MKKQKKKEFQVPAKTSVFYAAFKNTVMRLLFRKPKIINLAGELPKKGIILANHSAKSGPPSFDLYYPVTCAKWGAYQMFGNFKSRMEYLRDVLYIQKCGKKPGVITSFKAWFMAIFNPFVYRGMRMMPTYPDARFASTLRDSAKVLDADMSVMIFPENSGEGYKDVLTEFFPGFVMLAEKYHRATKEELPVYPVYYSIKKRLMVIGKALFVQNFVKQGLDRYQIAQRFCDEVNQLYFDYVRDV